MNEKHQTVSEKRINETTPVQPVCSPVADAAGVRWLVKRDDLIHPQISGNKWRKLKYNLKAARHGGFGTLATFGGAFSNHLYAVAAAGRLFGFKTVGIVRGERAANPSPTLQFAESCGMELVFWSREAYRSKENAPDFADVANRHAPFYLIPEGGTNELAVCGCAEIVAEISEPFDHITCACGTGGTLAGLIAGCDGCGQVIGFSTLKGGEFLVAEVEKLLENHYAANDETKQPPKNWHIRTEYHFGGYAKHTPALLDFMQRFEQKNGFLIEQVYTAKMFYGIEELMRQGYFRRGETVISLHTGGL